MYVNIIFLASAFLTISSSIAMLVVKNIMHSCVFLLGSLVGVAGLYISLGADFVAVTQVMVYVGGVVILMLFAVMLTGGKDFVSRAQKLLNLIPAMGNKWSYSIGLLTAFVFAATQIYLISKLTGAIKVNDPGKSFETTVEKLGELLITDHVLPFELSSVLLLGALIGAVIIARPRKASVIQEDEVEEHG